MTTTHQPKTDALNACHAARQRARGLAFCLEDASSRDELLELGRMADALEVAAGKARWAVREYVADVIDSMRDAD